MDEGLSSFCDWLEENGYSPFLNQKEAAKGILEMPTMSGRSWLIDRLFEFDSICREASDEGEQVTQPD